MYIQKSTLNTKNINSLKKTLHMHCGTCDHTQIPHYVQTHTWVHTIINNINVMGNQTWLNSKVWNQTKFLNIDINSFILGVLKFKSAMVTFTPLWKKTWQRNLRVDLFWLMVWRDTVHSSRHKTIGHTTSKVR